MSFWVFWGRLYLWVRGWHSKNWQELNLNQKTAGGGGQHHRHQCHHCHYHHHYHYHHRHHHHRHHHHHHHHHLSIDSHRSATEAGFRIYISIFAAACPTKTSISPSSVHKSILNLVPRLFLCKLVIYDPGSIWGEKYVISHNTGFNVIWEASREIQLCGKIHKYSAQRVTGREILRDTNFYKLCFMPFATQGRFRLPY